MSTWVEVANARGFMFSASVNFILFGSLQFEMFIVVEPRGGVKVNYSVRFNSLSPCDFSVALISLKLTSFLNCLLCASLVICLGREHNYEVSSTHINLTILKNDSSKRSFFLSN